MTVAIGFIGLAVSLALCSRLLVVLHRSRIELSPIELLLLRAERRPATLTQGERMAIQWQEVAALVNESVETIAKAWIEAWGTVVEAFRDAGWIR